MYSLGDECLSLLAMAIDDYVLSVRAYVYVFLWYFMTIANLSVNITAWIVFSAVRCVVTC